MKRGRGAPAAATKWRIPKDLTRRTAESHGGPRRRWDGRASPVSTLLGPPWPSAVLRVEPLQDGAWAGCHRLVGKTCYVAMETAEILDSQALMSHLTESGLQAEADQVLASAPVPPPTCASLAAMPAEAVAGWWHIFGVLSVQRLGEEIALAEAACRQDLAPESQNRLIALKTAFNKVTRGEPDGAERAA